MNGAADARARIAPCATTAILAADINGGAGARATRPARRRPRSSASPPRRCRTASSYEWTELTYQEILAGNTALLVFPLVRAARVPGAGRAVRELALPLAIILIVPMCLLAAIDRRVAHAAATTTSSRRSASSCWSAWRQERDPDRRVRARARVAGRTPVQAAIEAQPAAAAADPDDVARVHHGRGAAGALAPAPAPRCATRWASRCSPA